MKPNDINKIFRKAKLKKNDVVMIHGDAAVAAQFENIKPKTKLTKLLNTIIKYFSEGTIIIPTFTYSFAKGKTYNYLKSPSEVGMFSEAFRKHRGVKRTKQPIFSFAIIGKEKEKFLNTNINECFGENTVFDIFKKAKGKIICMGCSFDRITFVHHVEQMHGVKYRYLKNFIGKIMIKNQLKKINTTCYVRKLRENNTTCLNLLKRTALRKKNLFLTNVGKLPFFSISSEKFYDISVSMLKKNKFSLIKKL